MCKEALSAHVKNHQQRTNCIFPHFSVACRKNVNSKGKRSNKRKKLFVLLPKEIYRGKDSFQKAIK